MELDFSRDLHFVWALLPEVVLCVWAIVVLLVGVFRAGEPAAASPEPAAKEPEPAAKEPETPEPAAAHRQAWDLGWLSLGGLFLAALANGWLYGVHEVGGRGMIAVDGFRLFANWIFLVAAGMGILISFHYVYRQRLQACEFYALILFATAGMMVMAAARDLIVLFLGLEVMSVAVYALTAFNRRDRRSAEAGLKYFLLGAFSTGFFLYGIALVYGATGTTNVAEVAAAVQAGTVQAQLFVLGIALLAIGFGFKVSAVPFHMWTPDVYEGAPSPVTAFMSAGVKGAAFVAFARVFLTAFDGVYQSWSPVLWWMAAVTMVVANLVALVQGSVKRMLAYSSIAHAGYLLVAVTSANEMAAAGLLFYLLIYTVMNIGAFAAVICVSRQGEDNLQLDDYAGLGHRHVVLALILTIFLLSLAGLPGTGGFMAKIYLLQGAVEAELWSLAVILVLTTVVSYYYYLRVAWFMWMRDSVGEGLPKAVFVPTPTRIVLFAGAAIILYLGVFPSPLLEFARVSVEGFASVGMALPGASP